MKRAAVAVTIAFAALGAISVVPDVHAARGVKPIGVSAPPGPAMPERFDPEQSAALFVGIRKFKNAVLEVQSAADDAIDLAFQFTMQSRLVAPSRIVIALSGVPQKPESHRRLQLLQTAGATVRRNVRVADIESLFRQQARRAGRDGILILTIASHGFSKNAVPYVLASDSRLYDVASSAPLLRILDVASESRASRSLAIIDACRERADGSTRAIGVDPRTAAPLIRRMGRVHGQAVLFAAANGGYSYDDSGNGVFTKAILDNLQCGPTARKHVITLDSLGRAVEDAVMQWLVRNRKNHGVRSATQVVYDGDTQMMPLASCEPPPPPPRQVAHTKAAGSVVIATDANGTELWRRDVGSQIVAHRVADLDGDNAREVVIGTTRAILALSGTNRELWTAQNLLPLRELRVHEFGRPAVNRVVAILRSETRSRIALFDPIGRATHFDFAGAVQQLVIDRPTPQFSWKLLVAMAGGVALIEPSRISEQKWFRALSSGDRVRIIAVTDFDDDSNRDIVVKTDGGHTFVIDFKGKDIASRQSRKALAGIQLLPLRSGSPRRE